MPKRPPATSTQTRGGGVRRSPVQPSLEWLIDPISKQEFFECYWEKQPLVVIRDKPAYFASLLSLDEVDRVITTLDRRYPDIVLKNSNRDITADDYTVNGDSLDVAKAYQLFEEGSTITLAYLDTVVPALTSFCRNMENEFSFPFQTNVYLTPDRAQGAKYHYDTHDVFVLQVEGSKHWTIYGTPVELPLSEQDFDPKIHARGEPTLEFELKAGDMAYVPRGVVHDARSTKAVSLHITAGVLAYTWTDLLLELVADVGLHEPALRKALPPGFARQDFDPEQAREILRNLWQVVSAKSDLAGALDRFANEFVSKCPPPLRGQMAQIAALDRLSMDSVVGVRAGAIFRLKTDGDSAALECSGRQITFPLHALEAASFALGHPKITVRDLPGGLDDAGKLTLVRRLIREGLLMAHTT